MSENGKATLAEIVIQEVSIEVGGTRLADLFWEMGAEEQA